MTGMLTPTSLTAAMMPSAIMSQRTMPPKILIRIAVTLGFDRISLNAAVTRSLVAPPPTSKKVRRLAAVQLDQVHGRHGEARAVDHAGDIAVERHIVELVLGRLALHRDPLASHRALPPRSLCRNSALSSMLILASSASRSPSPVTISGLTSTRLASRSRYSL